MLPGGIHGWDVAGMDDVTVSSFVKVFEPKRSRVLAVRYRRCTTLAIARGGAAVRGQGIGLECMATGAAVRTYNILFAEHRPVAAALIAVDLFIKPKR